MKMYAIKDRLDGFTVPIPFGTDEVAIRWYTTMMETNVDMKHNPSDFELWYMGTYDKEKGEFTNDQRTINI